LQSTLNPDSYETEDPDAWYFLQPGTRIEDYIIESTLGGGGFSSVYLARQFADQQWVVLKEYLPRRLAHRTWGNLVIPNSSETRTLFIVGRKRFLEEAMVLTKFRHTSIVEVLNFFEANSTVYLVMTYEYGKILGDYLREKKGPMSEVFIRRVFPSLLEGVKCIHNQGYLHLDIKPHNILIRQGGEPLLLDFGAVQPYPTSGPPKPGKVSTPGFSPIEQYIDAHAVGPWSDLYAVGASMRMCLDGKLPPSAKARAQKDTLTPAVKSFRYKYSASLLQIIDSAMAMNPKDRPQSAQEMISALKF
jgi:serine/threonine protein kinase